MVQLQIRLTAIIPKQRQCTCKCLIWSLKVFYQSNGVINNDKRDVEENDVLKLEKEEWW